jgi:hypothetical protein
MTDEYKFSCDGCQDKYTGRCLFSDSSSRTQYKKTSACPCAICLVKAICVKSCEDFDTFWRRGIQNMSIKKQ